MAPSCLQGAMVKLYTSRAISSWGDRMWSFAVGLFMVQLTPGSFAWPAIYGLTNSIATIIFAPLIGEWASHSPRLKGKVEFTSIVSRSRHKSSLKYSTHNPL